MGVQSLWGHSAWRLAESSEGRRREDPMEKEVEKKSRSQNRVRREFGLGRFTDLG